MSVQLRKLPSHGLSNFFSAPCIFLQEQPWVRFVVVLFSCLPDFYVSALPHVAELIWGIREYTYYVVFFLESQFYCFSQSFWYISKCCVIFSAQNILCKRICFNSRFLRFAVGIGLYTYFKKRCGSCTVLRKFERLLLILQQQWSNWHSSAAAVSAFIAFIDSISRGINMHSLLSIIRPHQWDWFV